jgi:anti-sigma factor RsiW
MNSHQQIRELLALAAAGALDQAERERVERHCSECPECAAALAEWNTLAQSLRRLPTPQPSALAVARARAAAVGALDAARQRRESAVTFVFLGLFAWSFMLAGLVIFVLVFGGPLELGSLLAGRVPLWLAIVTALAWTAASAVAVILGARHREQGRLA